MSKYLCEATNIGNSLLAQAEQGKHGIWWIITTKERDGTVTTGVSESIYAGNSGVALFLIELYKQTKDKIYLDGAKDALRWAVWYSGNNPTDNYAFLTGRMGVSYALLKLFETTKDKRYLNQALRIAKPCQRFIGSIKEFINGTSGTLLALLHLHAASKEPWLLEVIDAYTDSLIKSARLGSKGLYWDTMYSQVRPLCGFSHGTSGIGYVFLELGRYFSNPAFYAVADQAFAYENAYYDAKKGNWPDFRISMWYEDQWLAAERSYRAGKLEMFNESGDMAAWCHGAPGIGLSRLRAFELTNKKMYQKDLQRACAKTKKTFAHSDSASFTLCHAEGGNAELFIESALAGDVQGLNNAKQVGDRALEQPEQLGYYASGRSVMLPDGVEDFDLFNGCAGVGYFLLRLHNPKQVPSILAPKITARAQKHTNAAPAVTMSLPQLQRTIIRNMFPRTIQLLEQHAPKQAEKYFQRKTAGDKDQFIRFVETLLPGMPQELANAFAIERQKQKLTGQHLSAGLIFVRHRLAQKHKQELLEKPDALLRQTFALPPECTLFMSPQKEHLLFKQTVAGVEENRISPFCYVVLQAFKKPQTIEHAVAAIVQTYGVQSKEERQLVQEKTLDQVRAALAYDALSLANS